MMTFPPLETSPFANIDPSSLTLSLEITSTFPPDDPLAYIFPECITFLP